jgi:hypothetical protein
MTRDTKLDTAHVWFDPDRGYVFRDTEEAPEGPYVTSTPIVFTEDLDPVETALWWLRRIVKNQGVLSVHDLDHVTNTVVPEAEKYYQELRAAVASRSIIT